MPEWGVTARESSWKQIDYGPDLEDIPGWRGQAVVRDVAAGVKYLKPQAVAGLRTWVHRTSGGAECFVMPFSGEEPPAGETFLELQKRLAAKRGNRTLKDGDPDLDRLDRRINQFLARVGELHDHQIPLGFVQPRSVLFLSAPDGGETVQLPDLGFVFDVDAWVMGRPSWLSDPVNDVMFDTSAKDRNKSYLAWINARNQETFQPLAEEDVRIAARLIAFALAGETEVRRWCGDGGALVVPPSDNGANDTACRTVWDVLDRAIRGEVHSVADLRQQLVQDGAVGDARPSRHFLVKPPRKVPAWERLIWRLAPPVMAAVGALLVAWVGYKAWEIWKPRTTAVCPHVTSWTNDLFPDLEKLANQKQTAAASAESKQRFIEALSSYVKLLRSSPKRLCDESCTTSLLAITVPWIDDEVNKLVRDLRGQPRHNAEEIALLTKERDRVIGLGSLASESSPPLFASALAKLDRQLALRGGTSVSADENAAEKVLEEPGKP